MSVGGKVPSLISRLNLTLRVARVTVRCRLIPNQGQDVTVFYQCPTIFTLCNRVGIG